MFGPQKTRLPPVTITSRVASGHELRYSWRRKFARHVSSALSVQATSFWYAVVAAALPPFSAPSGPSSGMTVSWFDEWLGWVSPTRHPARPPGPARRQQNDRNRTNEREQR